MNQDQVKKAKNQNLTEYGVAETAAANGVICYVIKYRSASDKPWKMIAPPWGKREWALIRIEQLKKESRS
jgi:hypothetical protein